MKTSTIYTALTDIQDSFEIIRNVPSDKKLQYEEKKQHRLNWKEQAEKIEKDYNNAAIKDAGAGVAGAGLGVAVVTMGPTVAMGVATTFGVASTGTAISALTVMEEAHNLLKRCDGLSNPLFAKSVEMIGNSIDETRTYGEGFVIVDQSPRAVDPAGVRNRNTKIVMRLPDYADCFVVGRAASLETDQIAEIAKLGTGEAVISQNNRLEAILAQIDVYKRDDFQGSDEVENQKSISELRGKEIKKYFEDKKAGKYDFSALKQIIAESDLDRFKKAEYIEYWEKIYQKSL